MAIGSIILQTVSQPDIVAPWDLPVWYWLLSAVAELFVVLLVFMWARNGRDKHEKKIAYDRSAENFNGVIQSGFGAIPYFLVLVWASVFVAIAGYITVSLITGVRY